MGRSAVSSNRSGISGARSGISSARSGFGYNRLPAKTFTDLGVTSMYLFGQGFAGNTPNVIKDNIGGQDLSFEGGTAIASVYTAAEHSILLDNDNSDYFRAHLPQGAGRTKLTAFGWARPDNAAGASELITNWRVLGSNRSWILRLASTGKLRIILSSTGSSNAITQDSADTNVYSSDEWQFFGFIYDGDAGTLKIMLGGVEISSTVISGSVPASVFEPENAYCIGASLSGSDAASLPFGGKIGITGIAIGKAMSDAEWLSLYNETNKIGQYV